MTSKKQAISNRRRKLFFVITLLFPIALIFILEFFLRIGGYGSDLFLFTTEVINNKTYHIINHDVKGRYFSHVDFSPNTSPDYFLMPKPDSTFRIFCLGGSTTAGFPYGFGGSFSSYLRDRLNALFSDKKVEVINLGITATNSFTVLDIAKELVDYQPDLLIVYDGHNEFYGALGTASRESFAGSRAMTLLYLRLVHLRSFQLLRNLYSMAAAALNTQSAEQQSGTMMERLARGQYIRYGSKEYNHCRDSFRANVKDLVDLCRAHNIPLFLGGQVSNLRDQPPFISVDESSPAAVRVDSLLARGKQYLASGKFSDALQLFREGIALDSLRADAHYDAARCLDTLGRKHEALIEYTNARDYDMLRFRMSSDFNNILREMDDDAHVPPGQEKFITFVDLERKFKANCADSLIGNQLILEHLHPNARGYFLIAKEYAWMMHWRRLIVNTDEEWNRRDALDDQNLWDERPLTEVDQRAVQRRIEFLKSGWPFRSETQPVPEVNLQDTLGVISEQLVRGMTTWEQAHVAAAEYYARRRDAANLEREYKTIVNQIPLNISAYLLLGQLYIQEHKNLDAASILVRSLDVEKTVFAYRTLGMLALEPDVASGFFEKAFALSTSQKDKAENGYLLAVAYLHGNKREKAISQLQTVLVIDPLFAPAQKLLNQTESPKP